MQVETSEELKYLLQVYAQETTFGDNKDDYCRLKLVAQRHLDQKINDSHFKARNRHEDRPVIGALSKGSAKRTMPKTTPRMVTASVGSQKKPMCIWRGMRIQA